MNATATRTLSGWHTRGRTVDICYGGKRAKNGFVKKKPEQIKIISVFSGLYFVLETKVLGSKTHRLGNTKLRPISWRFTQKSILYNFGWRSTRSKNYLRALNNKTTSFIDFEVMWRLDIYSQADQVVLTIYFFRMNWVLNIRISHQKKIILIENKHYSISKSIFQIIIT